MEKIFKAKRLDNGEWVEFGLFNVALDLGKHFKQFKDNTVDIFVDNSPVCIDKNTLCQYTGINDSEGNRIFEGDRVYIAGVGEVIAAMTPNGVTFGGWDYQDVIEDIEKLTGHNMHERCE